MSVLCNCIHLSLASGFVELMIHASLDLNSCLFCNLVFVLGFNIVQIPLDHSLEIIRLWLGLGSFGLLQNLI